MVAYSFKKEFGPPIQSGQKTGTIRGPRKRHAREGEHLQLFTGMRTKHCAKIIPDPVCRMVMPIAMDVRSTRIDQIVVGEAKWELHRHGADLFARRDGFEDMGAMHAFWLKEHGSGLFRGFWICWVHWKDNGLSRYFQ
jgi:hypothetical protein